VNRPVLAALDGLHTERTRSFLVFRQPSSSLVVHSISDGAVDNDIGQLVADELVRPGLVRGEAAFERCFAGIVESTAPSPHAAWRRFYANTLRALRRRRDDHPPRGPIATFERIYEHAEQLARGRSLLDVGSCFAFFPMLLAATGEMRVTASDTNPATVALARRMAGEFDLPVAFAIADLTRQLPFEVASFDTVTALHVLEHLPADQSHVALERLCRVARRRVVTAVPLEESPDEVYGHRQAFDLDLLAALGSCVPGWRGHAHEHLGGWLVLDRCVAPSRHVGG
jgi:hypothetical protein